MRSAYWSSSDCDHSSDSLRDSLTSSWNWMVSRWALSSQPFGWQTAAKVLVPSNVNRTYHGVNPLLQNPRPAGGSECPLCNWKRRSAEHLAHRLRAALKRNPRLPGDDADCSSHPTRKRTHWDVVPRGPILPLQVLFNFSETSRAPRWEGGGRRCLGFGRRGQRDRGGRARWRYRFGWRSESKS